MSYLNNSIWGGIRQTLYFGWCNLAINQDEKGKEMLPKILCVLIQEYILSLGSEKTAYKILKDFFTLLCWVVKA